MTMRYMLAVDLGLRTGLALYGEDGRLVWYRSHNFGSTERLKRGAHTMLNGIPGLAAMIVEGGGTLATVWEREAEKRNIPLRRVNAEEWRKDLLLLREQRSGSDAKKHADALARQVIAWSDAARPKSLRHDAAEAILIGLWGVLQLGWIARFPMELSH